MSDRDPTTLTSSSTLNSTSPSSEITRRGSSMEGEEEGRRRRRSHRRKTSKPLAPLITYSSADTPTPNSTASSHGYFLPPHRGPTSPRTTYQETTSYFPPLPLNPRDTLEKFLPNTIGTTRSFSESILSTAREYWEGTEENPWTSWFFSATTASPTTTISTRSPFYSEPLIDDTPKWSSETNPTLSPTPTPPLPLPLSPGSPDPNQRRTQSDVTASQLREPGHGIPSHLPSNPSPHSPSLSKDRHLQRAPAPPSPLNHPPSPSRLMAHPPKPSRKLSLSPKKLLRHASNPTKGLGGKSRSGSLPNGHDPNLTSYSPPKFFDPVIDTTHPNRAPPLLGYPTLHVPGPIKCLAVAGRMLLVGGVGLRGWEISSGKKVLSIRENNESVRITAVNFLPSRCLEDEGWYAWFGTSEGQLNHLDITNEKVFDRPPTSHRHPIVHTFRHRNTMVTLDATGEFQIWPERNEYGELLTSVTLDRPPVTSTIGYTRGDLVLFTGTEFWLANGRQLSIYHALAPGSPRVVTHDLDHQLGPITDLTYSESLGWVIMGHLDGRCSIWSLRSHCLQGMVRLSTHPIQSLLLVMDQFLWVAVANVIYVYDLTSTVTNPPPPTSGPTTWLLKKEFIAHDTIILQLLADPVALLTSSQYTVVSLDEVGQVKFWDGLLAGDWQMTHLASHPSDYCYIKPVLVQLCSWNVDACKPTDLLDKPGNASFLERWCQPDPHAPPDLLVIGLQEVVDLESKAVTAKSIFRKKEETGEHITQRYNKWLAKLIQVIHQSPSGHTYKLVECQNLIGLFTCIFVKESEYSHLGEIAVSATKTGFGGYHGNKGAIVVRFTWDDTSLCFTNCHLAAGQNQVAARNSDVRAILKKTTFPPITPLPLSPRVEGGGIALALAPDPITSPSSLDTFTRFVNGGDGQHLFDHELCFLSGDLNYRLDLPREKVDHLIRYHEWEQLQEYDQLLQLRRNRTPSMLTQFQEPPLRFAPTYKYNPHTDDYDTSEKRRCPAWCDRILYRGDGITPLIYKRGECDVSDHRPISATFRCPIKTFLPAPYRTAQQAARRRWLTTHLPQYRHHRLLHHLTHSLGYPLAAVQPLLLLPSQPPLDPHQIARHLLNTTRPGTFLSYE